jgi:hypothetical protein
VVIETQRRPQMLSISSVVIIHSTCVRTGFNLSLKTTFCRHRLQNCLAPAVFGSSCSRLRFGLRRMRRACAHVSAGQLTAGAKTWCGRRDLNPHGPFKPCGFSYRLRLSPPERDTLGGLTPSLRSGLSLHPSPEDPELGCRPSSLYTFPAGVFLRAWLGIAI